LTAEIATNPASSATPSLAGSGFYNVTAGANNQGFIEQGGKYTTIDDLAGVNGTVVTFDNDLGVIGGFYLDRNLIAHGFTDVHGRFATIDAPSAGKTLGSYQGTAPEVENLLGVIAGYYLDNNSVWHGFIDQGGHFTTIDAPLAGTGAGEGTDIGFMNDLGELSGTVFEGDGISSYSFVDNHGHYTTIFDPAGVTDGTYIGSVNDFGLIVGTYYDTIPMAHGFVDWNGTYTTIDDPAAVTGVAYEGTFVESSNNLGAIVGYYNATNGDTDGFVARYDLKLWITHSLGGATYLPR
jgi:uncharacterized membrane protein